jgi:hypothetical protein
MVSEYYSHLIPSENMPFSHGGPFRSTKSIRIWIIGQYKPNILLIRQRNRQILTHISRCPPTKLVPVLLSLPGWET